MLKLTFGAAVALIAYTHAGYPLLLAALVRLRGDRPRPGAGADRPTVSLIVAAYNEEQVIEARVRNARAVGESSARPEVVVVSDGSTDRTVELARAAGADVVLDRPHAGKVRAQDAGVAASSGELLAFSDANARWEPDALDRLVEPFRDPAVGYVCGQLTFERPDGTNEEGLYWRYELAIRALESRLAGVTAGNGAIYATRRESYIVVDPRMGHDLSFPFNMVKRGWLAVYEPSAHAREKMVPSIEGEFRRKRRMMSHTWPIVITGGMLSPRGYPPLYALQILSHRLLRYATPFIHVIALAANLPLARRQRGVYALTLAAQVGFLAAAAAAGAVPLRALRLARYYLLVTAAPAAGLWDWLSSGTPAGWEQAEGTR